MIGSMQDQDIYLLVGLVFLASLVIVIALFLLISNLKATNRKKIQRSSGAIANQDHREPSSRIYHLISELSASLNYQHVLETALDLSTATLASMDAPVGDLLSAVLVFTAQEQGGTKLQTAYARGLSVPDMRLAISGTSGFIGKVIDDGAPGITSEIRADPELNRFAAFSHIRSIYCAPLRSGLDTYGIILFAHPQENFFQKERRDILDIVSKQTGIAMQNALLFQALQTEKERMVELQENSNKKLARELHDGPTQTVAAIAMRVNFARRLMEKDPKAAVDELQKIEDLARKTTKEIRHMLFTLRPLVLESQGLQAALRTLSDKMKETFNQDVIVEIDERVLDNLEQTKQAVVFFIIEEAVNNARKHAQAAHIFVRLKLIGEDLCFLEIQDDGIGFNPDAVEASYSDRGSLGMLNMRERTELINGVLRVDSSQGSGTRIQVAIPLTDAAAEKLRRGRKSQ